MMLASLVTTLYWAVFGAVLLFAAAMALQLIRCYKRCPDGHVLVIYGHTGGDNKAVCLLEGGRMVWPVIQDCAVLSLAPFTVPVDIEAAVAKDLSHLKVHATYTVAIDTSEPMLQAAAARLLGRSTEQVVATVREVIVGRTRRTLSSVTLEQIEANRPGFAQKLRTAAQEDLAMLGLKVVESQLRDVGEVAVSRIE